ncbi:MlaC/ttg2D family ABC transporter substrate-binding protein [Pusillimonas noertemannii]|uniref:Phospholipid transport system substrate-binding protein n=1 Tax=Pusillimonas noertemannii TaxID=305977 RepID=A0A2U1CNS8_9BURK|nr:ABC transporter substrate-binding protein [Pusillimonas noertemannii]NYT68314.1 ABC transporter substrate-binding protein [Pusillimonas noertemannii]PVY62671.1 phospholipid transport system substrate-binding protein [Pusillimonas noertemannii]TFL10389.1 ABC transporter substrate-binding protein [Pusillimonas noertemannii]
MTFSALPQRITFLHRLCLAFMLALGLSMAAQAKETVDPTAAPNEFVQAVGNNALEVLRQEPAAQQGDLNRINQLVDEYVLPYVNLEKTTRLAAGRYWRQASAQQQKNLVEAFKGTLIRTYSGALSKVDEVSALQILPFRGDANADDVVVRSTISQRNGPAVGVDYRLEKTPQGWKIYDLNVEGIWLIQNYRNQFAQQINQNGIDGLIDALNKQNR